MPSACMQILAKGKNQTWKPGSLNCKGTGSRIGHMSNTGDEHRGADCIFLFSHLGNSFVIEI